MRGQPPYLYHIPQPIVPLEDVLLVLGLQVLVLECDHGVERLQVTLVEVLGGAGDRDIPGDEGVPGFSDFIKISIID